MTADEARAIVSELRTRFDSPFSTADKASIRSLYRDVLAKELRQTNCQQCYHDALIEIYLYLKNHDEMKARSNYQMRAGFIIACPTFRGGMVYTNDNLTDEVAEEYMDKFPMQAKYFDKVGEKRQKTGSKGMKGADVDNVKPKARKPRSRKNSKK